LSSTQKFRLFFEKMEIKKWKKSAFNRSAVDFS